MSDPFEALHAPPGGADPDPAFRSRLRARIERALTLPKGVIVSSTTLDLEPEPTAAPGVTSLVPYLAVADARSAIDWYVEALGASRRSEPIVMPDGRIGHAELIIGGAVLMLADEYPEIGHVAPTGEGVSVSLHLTVADVDAATARAVDAGATLERPPADAEYGRSATLRDPFGHRWMLMTEPRPTLRHGDIGYTSLQVPDIGRASTFFTSVLGWHYLPDASSQGRQVAELTPQQGMWGDQPRGSLFLSFSVDDVRATIDRVRAAGGTAEEPTQEAYGLAVNCVDDQGMAFAAYQLTPGNPGLRAGAGGWRQGAVTYVTVEAVDSARFRAFFGAVLGWRFEPGRVEDGWQVLDVAPMTGVHGGHAQLTVLPMYVVDDVAAAVARVRQQGGTSTDPERQPYGLTAECADDQGTRFYLIEY